MHLYTDIPPDLCRCKTNKKQKTMKKILSLISVALLLGAALAVSCKKIATIQTPEEDGEMASLTISLSGVDADISTRASATGEYNGDKTASSVQILVFDSEGNFLKKLTAAGSVKLSKGMVYKVAAVVNGPAITDYNLTQTRDVTAILSTNPYVMYGECNADLTTASSASATVTVKSLASRVHLTSISNRMPAPLGDIVLKRVFLCNVKAAVKLDGTDVAVWYNQYGRASIGMPVTNGSLSQAVSTACEGAAYTLKSFDSGTTAVANGGSYSPNAYFYSFPNPLSTAIPADAPTANSWTDQAAWLTIAGTMSGLGNSVYYWTVNLGEKLASGSPAGLAANTSYDVAITINNLGSPNPGIPVTEGEATLGITVTPWQAGSEITQTF